MGPIGRRLEKLPELSLSGGGRTHESEGPSVDMCRGGGAEGAGLLEELQVLGTFWCSVGEEVGEAEASSYLACTVSGFCYQDSRSGSFLGHCRSPRGPSLSAFLIPPVSGNSPISVLPQ